MVRQMKFENLTFANFDQIQSPKFEIKRTSNCTQNHTCSTAQIFRNVCKYQKNQKLWYVYLTF